MRKISAWIHRNLAARGQQQPGGADLHKVRCMLNSQLKTAHIALSYATDPRPPAKLPLMAQRINDFLVLEDAFQTRTRTLTPSRKHYKQTSC